MPNPRPSLLSACVFVMLASLASAQDAPPAPTEPAIVEVIPLGTAGGPPIRINRSEPATLVRVDDKLYLVDTGIGTVRRLVQAGGSVAGLNALFITHLHPDHVMDLTALISDRLFALGNGAPVGPLQVYGPPGTEAIGAVAISFVDLAFETFFVQGWGAKFQKPYVVFHDVPEGAFFRDGTVEVSAQENTHYVLMTDEEREIYKTYAFRMNTPNGDILFTGDTGPDERMHGFGKDVDLMVGEVTNLAEMKVLLTRMLSGTPAESVLPVFIEHIQRQHLEPEEVARIANGANAGAVVLNHFGPDAETAGTDVIREGVQAAYDGDVYVPEDLQVYCLTRPAGAPRAEVSLCRSEATP
ncbi:MAG: MBL fold metallo-hydrolase [Qingshengfaniella sp.]